MDSAPRDSKGVVRLCQVCTVDRSIHTVRGNCRAMGHEQLRARASEVRAESTLCDEGNAIRICKLLTCNARPVGVAVIQPSRNRGKNNVKADWWLRFPIQHELTTANAGLVGVTVFQRSKTTRERRFSARMLVARRPEGRRLRVGLLIQTRSPAAARNHVPPRFRNTPEH